eukprot:141464-Chlamydomonas_euryale.AAC.2
MRESRTPMPHLLRGWDLRAHVAAVAGCGCVGSGLAHACACGHKSVDVCGQGLCAHASVVAGAWMCGRGALTHVAAAADGLAL